MSRQPGVTMAGVPVLPAASSRVGPAPRMPPTNSSAHSVVVMSSTPAVMPASTSDSIARPPVPVAWKTSTSKPAFSKTDFAVCTHCVVFPNMLATMMGLSSVAGMIVSTIPQIAPAARPRMVREMRLSPATSTMAGIITMSFTPTYCAVLPLASVETMSFGNPSGRARIAVVQMEVPPPPPREMTPSISPAACICASTTAAACPIAATHSPRSLRDIKPARSSPLMRATSSRETCGSKRGG